MWIESHQSLSRHRKTLRAVALLKVDRHKLLGHLHELWWWAIDNADADGRLGQATTKVLTEAAGWPLAQAEAFVGALCAAGFLDLEDDGYRLHDWYEYAGKLSDRRASNRARMQAARRQRPPDADDAVQRTSGARATHVQDTGSAAQPDTDDANVQGYRTGPNRTGPNRTGTPQSPPEKHTNGATYDVSLPPTAACTNPACQRDPDIRELCPVHRFQEASRG